MCMAGGGPGLTTTAVIPARYASTRFPGKPLARDTGKYLIQHVYEQVAKCGRIDRLVVATDDERIAEAVRSFGGEARITRPDHCTGTDRVGEVAASLNLTDNDLVLNVQGDEPEIAPEVLDKLIDRLRAASGNFSRSPIPYLRETDGEVDRPSRWLLHLGVYAFRADTLRSLTSGGGLGPSPLEETESLEQLRWLERGLSITVVRVAHRFVGIDTPEDYAAFVKRTLHGTERVRAGDQIHGSRVEAADGRTAGGSKLG